MKTTSKSTGARRSRKADGSESGNSSIRFADAETMVFLGKYSVHPQFFETIEWRVTDILPHLLAGVAYTPSELVGEDLWSDITSLGQRQATLCLRHMARMPGATLREVAHSGSDLTMFEITATAEDMA
jgi:hypothetical protein